MTEAIQPEAKTRLLVIDDDDELRHLLSQFLDAEDFEVTGVADGEAGLEILERESFEIVVLDIGLPGMSGLEVLDRIRASSWVPVIMLTASGDLDYRIRGLAAGADDYLPKPFSTEELVLRIRAVLRRAHDHREPAPTNLLHVDDIVIDYGSLEVQCGGRTASLTSAEIEILGTLAKRAGRVVSRHELAEAALHRPCNAFDRSLDVHISRIRRKLGPRFDGRPRIKTIRGEGYLFVRPRN